MTNQGHDATPVQVSVIIPVFNAAEWLETCLRSVLAQTDVTLEVLCVDDASDDGSDAVLRRVASEDARVRVFSLDRAPTGAVRNFALARATGQFVAFLDADDLYPDNAVLSRLVRAAEDAALPVAGGYLVPFAGNPPLPPAPEDADRTHSPPHAGIWRYRDFQEMYGFYTFVFRRDFLVSNRLAFPERSEFEDPSFLVAALMAAEKSVATDTCVYLYRQGHKAAPSDEATRARRRERLRAIRALMPVAVENNFPILLRKLFFEAVGPIRSRRDFDGVRDELKEVFRYYGKFGRLTLKDRLLICHWSVPDAPFPRRVVTALTALYWAR